MGIAIVLSMQFAVAYNSPATVNLGTAGNFVILSKAGITTTGTTAIVGNLGVSPIDSTAMTGFGLIADSSNKFSTSSLVTGKIYASDYTSPTPSVMTSAVSDMETAYTNSAGRTLPDATELGAGDISGMTIAPGLYKWGTGVHIDNRGVTLSGNSNDVWIFQISQDLTVDSAAIITLTGGAQARNVFWQVGGGTGVILGTTSVFNGNILAIAGIVMNTGATLNGRALAQTAVTLDANMVRVPSNLVEVIVSDERNNSEINNSSNSTSRENSSLVNDSVVVNNQESNGGSSLNDNGIGQELSQRIEELRTEFRYGNFTTSLGEYLNVREIGAGIRELRENNISVRTRLNLTKVGNNDSKLEVELSNGRNAEIKVMPSAASEIALARLKLKVCNETNNCTIELKEVGKGNDTRVAYETQVERHYRILGIFSAKAQNKIQIDAETGDVISENKPWWAFISSKQD